MFMDVFGEFGQKIILELGSFKLTFSQAFILVTGLIAIILVNVFAGNLVKRSAFYKNINKRLSKLILRSLSYIIWIVGITALLRIESVNVGNFF